MNREELLKWIKGKISDYYYDILVFWTKNREKRFIFFQRKFDLSPTIFGNGYIIRAGLESIIVYK